MSQIIIEEEKLQHNIERIKERIQNRTDDQGNPVKIIAVLKGNAYGMGATLLAQKLNDCGIDMFAVTEVAEAIELRKEGFQNEILILNGTSIPEEIEKIVDYNLTATIGSAESARRLNQAAKQKHKMVKCHLKIDTGFGRFGFLATETIGITVREALANQNQLKVVGTYSHFQESYAKDEKRTKEQFQKFLDAVAALKMAKVETGMLHICNSAAFFQHPEMYLNAVRIGSAFSGRLQIVKPTGLQRVGYLESQICEIRNLLLGSKVGYSGTCKLKRNTRVAIVEAGYADGVYVGGPKDSVRMIDKLRALKKDSLALLQDGRRYVEIQGVRCPILGRIGMKNMMVDVTDCPAAQIGDCVKIDVNLVLANQKMERRWRTQREEEEKKDDEKEDLRKDEAKE